MVIEGSRTIEESRIALLRSDIKRQTRDLEEYKNKTVRNVTRSLYGLGVALLIGISALGVRLYDNKYAMNHPLLSQIIGAQKSGNRARADELRNSPEFVTIKPELEKRVNRDYFLKKSFDYSAVASGFMALGTMGVGCTGLGRRRKKLDMYTRELQELTSRT